MASALLIIDVQQALCSGDYEAFEVGRIIDNINQVARLFRDKNRPVIVIQHETASGPFEFGCDGWKVDARLHTMPTDIVMRKTATDSFHQTNLQAILNQHQVDTLVICGLQSEFCVDTTTRRALALGYPVRLVADGHSTVDNAVLTAAQISAHHNETLSNITSFGPRASAILAADIQI